MYFTRYSLPLFLPVLCAFGLYACSSNNSDRSPLSGELIVMIEAPAETSLSLTITTWDGESLVEESETASVPQSGRYEYGIPSGDYEGVHIEVSLFGQAVEFLEMTLVSDGDVLEETDTPDNSGNYVIEVGTLPGPWILALLSE